MRIDRFVKLLNEMNFDGAFISPGSNLYYLTGLKLHEVGERPTILVVSADGEYKLLAPSLYSNVITNFPVTFWRDGENPYAKLSTILGELKLYRGRFLVEDTMRADWLIGILKLGNFEFHPLSSLIRLMRMRKDREEIENMKHAARIADKVFEEILSWDILGMSEKELALKIEVRIRELSDGVSFSPIVASGENSANPHHEPGERKIRKGDIVILDYGARWRGYCSDITRTIAVGRPDEKLIEVYEIVKEAQEKAYRAVREGIKAKEVDKVAREVISEAGYGEYFTHRTGHGLGLDVHEEPYIGPDGEVTLENGMTFTIEPGIYIPGLGGVRIEDDVVVEGKGKRLTKAGRELITV
ncbi:aminopeptidase P family protein [Pyrococcus abyssi]|uniref:X-pro aminopeptidase n=1 Tax=Pyrococcus abyssi (strain GE5 / Orsay) TaxID=272844 RepID=Q9V0B6_PYRAB|nr:aminopeptidase P family protein [Pyrococcus abyssi]CAB49788.1 pepQ-3 X-pro aminopeptidase [Pyrococcus abyssi GE5]CCE70280.1 TPA: X-pro aminopeptidase [Pyrococcus abyssi GE5]